MTELHIEHMMAKAYVRTRNCTTVTAEAKNHMMDICTKNIIICVFVIVHRQGHNLGLVL